MKHVFLSFVLILVASFAFGSSNKSSEKIPGIKLSKIAVSDDLKGGNDLSFNLNQKSISNFEQGLELQDCTLKGKFTITMPDGSCYMFDGEITIVGVSCGQFLKELMAALS